MAIKMERKRGLSVLDLGPTYTTDVRRASSLNAPTLGAGHNNELSFRNAQLTKDCHNGMHGN